MADSRLATAELGAAARRPGANPEPVGGASAAAKPQTSFILLAAAGLARCWLARALVAACCSPAPSSRPDGPTKASPSRGVAWLVLKHQLPLSAPNATPVDITALDRPAVGFGRIRPHDQLTAFVFGTWASVIRSRKMPFPSESIVCPPPLLALPRKIRSPSAVE